ncbi:heat shock 70 kDa protein 17 [Cyclospora cayetanensis]|uniref:Heat shock 70 kDa protein 17 n=1 Tax=Cyclospora cayetanensis TaxID=88456 RepID=A0A6P6RQC2_9EIME|nr:heat shock 70 kDa protein 17 [Cyclospora cayetanensis]
MFVSQRLFRRRLVLPSLCGLVVALLLPLLQQQQTADAQVLGIDVGSEFIKAAVVAPGKRIDLVLSNTSSRKFPNAISFVEKDTCALSEDAIAEAHKNPKRVFQGPSLFLGLSAQEVGDLVIEEGDSSDTGLQRVTPKEGYWPGGISAAYNPWEVYASPTKGGLLFKVRDDLLLPPESLIAAVLSYIRQTAAAAAHLPPAVVLGAVVSVPCRYTQRQRAALRDSLEIAGFKVVGFVSHGAAAGVQHALDTYDRATAAAVAAAAAGSAAKAETKLTLNVGSSSVDAALLSFQAVFPNANSKQEAVPLVTLAGCSSTAGGGGRAVDVLVAEMLRQMFEGKNKGMPLSGESRALKKLEKQAAATKTVLSASKTTFVRVERLYKGKNLEEELTRDSLETQIEQSELLRHLQAVPEGALASAEHTLEEIEEVELLGGGLRVPRFLKHINEWAGKGKTKTHLNGDEAMATGAAFVAANSTATFRVRKLLLQDGAPYTYSLRFLGLQDEDEAQQQQDQASQQLDETSQQQDGGSKVKVLVAPFKRLAGSKRVSVRTRSDFVVQLLEDEKLLSTHSITGVLAAHQQRQQDIDKEKQQQQEQEQQQRIEDDKEAPKAELVFSIDSAGVIELTKATLVFERTTYTPEPQKETPVATPEQAEGTASDSHAESTEAEKKCEDPNDPACASKANTKSDSNSGNDATNKGKRVVHTFRYPLSYKSEETAPVPLTAEEKAQLKELLLQQEARNLAAKQLIEGLNALETYIYSARGQLLDGSLDRVTNEIFKQDMLEKIKQVEEWIYGEAAADGLKAVQERLSDLRETLNPVYMRAKEAEARPALINKADKLLQDVEQRLEQYASTRPWIPEAKISGVRTLRNELLQWWEEAKQKQADQSLLLPPVFTEAEVLLKLKDLQKKIKALEAIPKPTTTTTTTPAPAKEEQGEGMPAERKPEAEETKTTEGEKAETSGTGEETQQHPKDEL